MASTGGTDEADQAWDARFHPEALEPLVAALPAGPVRALLEARLAQGLSRIDDALRACEEALAGLDDHPLWHARALELRGNCLKEIGLVGPARENLQQAWDLYDELGDLRGRATVRQNMAALDFLAPEAAHELFLEALDLARRAGDLVVQGLVHLNLWVCESHLGTSRDERRAHLLRAEELLEAGWPALAVRVRCLRVKDAVDSGDVETAAALSADLPRPWDTCDRLTRGDTAMALAGLALAQGDATAAVELLQRTLETDLLPSSVTALRRRLTTALREAGRTQEALDEADRAIAAMEQRLEEDRAADLRALDAVHRSAMLREERRRERERADELQRALDDLQEAHERISRMSSHDVVTGLRNRLHLMEQAPRLLQNASPEAPGQIALIDLDHFKRVNDGHGHPVGDQVLMAFADVLRAVLRPDDLVARYGGEEFVVVRPPWGEPADLVGDLERVREALATGPWVGAGGDPLPRVTLSAGVVTAAGQPLERALGEADARMYSAKRAGRDRIEARRRMAHR